MGLGPADHQLDRTERLERLCRERLVTDPAEQLRVPTRTILRGVTDAYQPCRAGIAERGLRVLMLHFAPAPEAPAGWHTRMEASAQQNVRVFTALGVLGQDVDDRQVAEHARAGLLIEGEPPVGVWLV